VRAKGVAAARLVELAARVGVAGDLDDAGLSRARAGQVQAVVTTEGIGLLVALVVGEEPLRAIALVIDREVEDVVRVGRIAQGI
jgi:hypothetical protein